MSLPRKLKLSVQLASALAGRASLAFAAGAGTGIGLAVWAIRRARRYEISGKVVVITGGSRGLGLALARAFLHKKAKIALLARDAQELERARQLLAGSGDVFAQACDMREQTQVSQALSSIRQHFGRIDVLVNNAGTLTVGPMDSMTPADFQEALDIFFWAPLHAILAVLPEMRQRRSGRIVNISSIGGKISVPHLLPYSVGKFALAGFSEGLRAELASDNVYVTSVFPGLMRTGSPRNAHFKGQHRAEYTWFLLSDSLPGFTMSADRAARQIVRACEAGRAELIVTFAARFAIKLRAFFPGFSSFALALVTRRLPAAARTDVAVKKKGSESATALTESWLTELDRRAARKNNQIRQLSAVNP